MRIPVAVLIVAAFASGGCGTSTTLDRNVRLDDGSRDAIVVFGFRSDLKLWLYPGVDDGVNWHCEGRRARGFLAEHGFIVARLPARTGKHKYAIGRIKVEWNTDAYGPTANAPIWVFSAPAGQVTYLGALRVNWFDGRPAAIIEDKTVTQKDADDYLTTTFPQLPHVVTGRMDWVYVSFDEPHGCM